MTGAAPSGTHPVTELVRGLVASTSAPRVAVLAGGPRSDVADLLSVSHPGLGVTVVDAGLPRWRAWAELAAAGPLDVLVDDTGSPDEDVARFRANVQLLGDGGTYAAPASGSLLEGLGEEGSHHRAEEVRTAGGYVLVLRRGRSLAKMREREMNAALTADPSRGRILSEVPGVAFDSLCAVHGNLERSRVDMKDAYEAPPLFLREYADVVCAPRSVVVQRNLLTPDTYRHHLAKRLKNKALRSTAPRFAAAPFDDSAATPLEGSYFHLDNEFRGYFGHALTEQVSRLWAWRETKRREPGLKALIGAVRGTPLAEWQRVLLASAGVEPDDIVLFERPVRVERLLAATPMFSMPDYVHPRIVEVWDGMSVRLREQAEHRDRPERIFVTRAHGKRMCRNGQEVEDLFAAHGFEIVLPEQHPLPDQVEMFHRADVVAGWSGSGMFSVLFSDRPKHLVLIGSSSYGASNEYMISAVRGHRLDLVTSQAEVDPPEGRFSREAFTSAFTCDMQREGAWLREILADL